MLKARASQAPVAELAASTPVAPGQELRPGRGCGGTSLCSFSRVMREAKPLFQAGLDGVMSTETSMFVSFGSVFKLPFHLRMH